MSGIIKVVQDPADQSGRAMMIVEFQGALNVDPNTVNGRVLSEVTYNADFKVDIVLM